MTDSPAQQPDQTITVPVFQEQLSVEARTVDTGRGVRVYKTVHEQPVTIDETLRHDETTVRHVAIDRLLEPGSTPPAMRHEGDVLIIPVLEEVLVVERRLRLKEELHITRTHREETYTETVTLKSEHVAVERFDDLDPSQK